MKKVYITILNIILVNILYAQNDNISYLYSLETNGFESFYSLKTNENFSMWNEVEKMKIKENSYDYSVSYVEDENYALKQVYKNFNDSTMLSNNKIIGKNYYISEKINNLKWQIIDSTENILNYDCQIAKINYKGRKYYASFSTKIANSHGPWKFHGLPGMILKVVSIENNEYYKMECVEIKNSKSINYEDVYVQFISKHNFLNWNEFLVDVNKLIDNHISSAKSRESTSNDGGGGYYLIKLKNYMEIFNKEIQTSGIIID